MSDTARRPVPHINHTDALAQAVGAVVHAFDANGRAIVLCSRPMDVECVRYALGTAAEGLKDPSFTYESDEPTVELTAIDNLMLLATLLKEHLKAGNT